MLNALHIYYSIVNSLFSNIPFLRQVIAIMKGHSKKVNRVIYHPSEDTVLTGSHDSTIRIWNVPTSQSLKIMRVHQAPVTGLSLHATGDYVLSTSIDQSWAFSDVREGRLITKVTSAAGDDKGSALTCAQFHPDGLIFGTGTSSSVIKIWDLKEVSQHSIVISNLAMKCARFSLATKRGQLRGA